MFLLFQYIAPQHALSKFAGWVASCKFPPLKNYLIKWFIKRYGVNMQEALTSNPNDYENFQSFFIRHLKQGSRTIDPDSKIIVSPADGTISQIGAIQAGRIFQAKGFDFNIVELLGDKKEEADLFSKGQFSTLYLAPKDYHRVHMPFTGKLISMTYVPGQLFSVNAKAAEKIPNLFARNERVICLFKTDFGHMAVVLVGAMIVGSIHMVWSGDVVKTPTKKIQTWVYADQRMMKKGEEIGYFKLGSTVIVLLSGEQVQWENLLDKNAEVRVGEGLVKHSHSAL